MIGGAVSCDREQKVAGDRNYDDALGIMAYTPRLILPWVCRIGCVKRRLVGGGKARLRRPGGSLRARCWKAVACRRVGVGRTAS